MIYVVCLVGTLFDALEYRRLICYFKSQKGDYVRIILVFSFLRE
jgi:hypothetical protein